MTSKGVSLLKGNKGTLGKFFFLISLISFISLASPALADSPRSLNRLVVSPKGPYTTIQAALAVAQDGDQIQVLTGTYAGPLVVTKSVILDGVDYPIIDNGSDGTVVTLAAPDSVLRGFELRNSGSEYDRDHSGIMVTAPRVLVENNRLRQVLFGIFVVKANDVILRGNDVTSKDGLDIGLKGDAIRLWYSQHVTIENNHVHNSRDLVVWYSSDATIRNNLIERGRYGVHLMYCDNAIIAGNRFLDNSVGIYTMYSNTTLIRDNLIRGHRGPSGYAIGLKDADDIEVAHNALIDNRGGAFLDGAPFSPEGHAYFHDNIFAFNDAALIMMPAVRGALIENNSFWENVEQVTISGGGRLGASIWRNNYWSDYKGFDANDSGVGTVPYRTERYFEGLLDREPYLRMLIYSPAAQAVEFAGTAFPIVRPEPKFTDNAPRIEPVAIPDFAKPTNEGAGGMFFAAIAMLFIGAGSGALAFVRK